MYAVATTQLDGRSVVVSGSGDGTVRVWDLATGQPLGLPLRHGDQVFAVATAQLDGRPVVISGGGVDETLRMWDLATGQPVRSPFTSPTDPVFAVVTAQLDGRSVVVFASADDTVRVRDLTTGEPVGPRSPATPAVCGRWRLRSWAGARSWSPAVPIRRCGCGI